MALTGFLGICLSACAVTEKEDKKPAPYLEKSSFLNLNDWENDNHLEAFHVFLKSCEKTWLRSGRADRKIGFGNKTVQAAHFRDVCSEGLNADITSDEAAREFFENNFQPFAVSSDLKKNDKHGLFTGYYEPTLNGSRERHGPYQTPVYARPDDLVTVDLGEFKKDLRGERIAGRVSEGRLRPYDDRRTIDVSWEAGQNADVIAWVDDPLDAFFLHIQGSGVIRLTEGGSMRVGFAGHNGHRYYAIGREMAKRENIDPKNVSLQSIRNWLDENPQIREEVLHTNPSYIFFTKRDVDGAVGAEGLVLTPRRSLAVDHGLYSYGFPVWVDIEPVEQVTGSIRRLMIAQDTGGAIRGPVRGDVFWGAGDIAETIAGKMKSQGRKWILLPTSYSQDIAASGTY